MHTPVSFLVAYTFAVLTPAVQAVDTIIQWLTVQHKSWVYIFGRITYLLVALGSIVALIVYIHTKMDGPEAAWMPALVALCGFSTLLGISMQAIMAWRMFDNLDNYWNLQRSIQIVIGFATFMVLSFNLLGFVFAIEETYRNCAPIIIALGSFWAYFFFCCIALSFCWRNLFKTPFLGLSCCCLINSLGAAAVLGLLPLSHTDWFLPGQVIVAWTLQIPWIWLLAYKLLPRGSSLSSSGRRGDNNVSPLAEEGVEQGVSSSETALVLARPEEAMTRF